jgi:hypothetical protein
MTQGSPDFKSGASDQFRHPGAAIQAENEEGAPLGTPSVQLLVQVSFFRSRDKAPRAVTCPLVQDSTRRPGPAARERTRRVAAPLFSAYPGASAAQVRRAIIAGANRDVPGLRGTNEANGLLSASGALAAMDARARSVNRSNATAP